MTKLILISHGKLSEGMAYSAQMIAGENENLSYYGLMPGGDVEKDVIQPIRTRVQAEPDNQFLIVSDLFCGSVYNASFGLQNEPNVLIGTGMNLSLVTDLLINMEDGYTAESFAQAIEDSRQFTMVLPKLEGAKADSAEDFF